MKSKSLASAKSFCVIRCCLGADKLSNLLKALHLYLTHFNHIKIMLTTFKELHVEIEKVEINHKRGVLQKHWGDITIMERIALSMVASSLGLGLKFNPKIP